MCLDQNKVTLKVRKIYPRIIKIFKKINSLALKSITGWKCQICGLRLPTVVSLKVDLLPPIWAPKHKNWKMLILILDHDHLKYWKYIILYFKFTISWESIFSI